jgi:hypothetical protein
VGDAFAEAADGSGGGAETTGDSGGGAETTGDSGGDAETTGDSGGGALAEAGAVAGDILEPLAEVNVDGRVRDALMDEGAGTIARGCGGVAAGTVDAPRVA